MGADVHHRVHIVQIQKRFAQTCGRVRRDIFNDFARSALERSRLIAIAVFVFDFGERGENAPEHPTRVGAFGFNARIRETAESFIQFCLAL